MTAARLGYVFAPNWPPGGQTYRVRYEYLTEIITSHAGRESRVARRSSPRKSLEYQTLLIGEQFNQFKTLMRSGQHLPVMIPEVTRSAVVAESQDAGELSLRLQVVPSWVLPGAKVWAGRFSELAEVITVDYVDDDLVFFTTELVHAQQAGAVLYPALTGYVGGSVSAPRRTNAVAQLQVGFSVEPLSEVWAPPGVAPHTFNGRELFLRRPNWLNPVTVSSGREVVEVDFGSGPVARYTPTDFGFEVHQATYLSVSRDEATAIVDFFRRMRGRQGEFYMPTWEYDFVPAAPSPAGSTILLAEGRGAHDVYSNSAVYDAVFVLLRTGELLVRRILHVTAAGDNSSISVAGSWGHLISRSTVVMCGWLPVWRFASDNLTVEWVTDSVANMLLNLISLESLPAESA